MQGLGWLFRKALGTYIFRAPPIWNQVCGCVCSFIQQSFLSTTRELDSVRGTGDIEVKCLGLMGQMTPPEAPCWWWSQEDYPEIDKMYETLDVTQWVDSDLSVCLSVSPSLPLEPCTCWQVPYE